jgi:hypothetical protein
MSFAWLRRLFCLPLSPPQRATASTVDEVRDIAEAHEDMVNKRKAAAAPTTDAMPAKKTKAEPKKAESKKAPRKLEQDEGMSCESPNSCGEGKQRFA